ncbi:MAG: DegT/DnrJ/EryC1/StrS family aminotransferase [Bacteroidales bacterium]
MQPIQMVDLKSQYQKIKTEIDEALINCVESTNYINGPEVIQFQEDLMKYLGVKHVIPCANGTDALQIAIMALGLNRGDEIIVPAFTYVATAEAIALLGLVPVVVDVDSKTFNIDPAKIENAITPKTKAIVPVHLFGQSADMEAVLMVAKKYELFVIEDNAQALGADYKLVNGNLSKTGTIGHIGCYSFFPTKNLGCFGDGGAISTNDDLLAEKCKMIANHGQKKKYYHSVVGCNSRLDTMQAAILTVKLKYLDSYIKARQETAKIYYAELDGIDWLSLPYQSSSAIHTFNQFTLIVKENLRDDLQKYLISKQIPTIIYYPLPLYKQEAFLDYSQNIQTLPITESLCQTVLSIPIHTELSIETQKYITDSIRNFR